MPKPTQATKARKQQIQTAIPEVATVRHTTAMPSFDELPDSAFIRESQLVQSSKRPDTPAPWPFSAATYWRKIKTGTLPTPYKLSSRISAQKVGECREISAAWAQGKSEAEIRELVNRLHAKRADLATD